VQRLPAQVEIAVLEANILGIIRLTEDWQRQLRCFRLHTRLFHTNFDLTCVEVGIHQLGITGEHFAFNCDDAFRAQALNDGESRKVRVEDALRQTIMIAQVDEHDATMVSAAVEPAGKFDRLTDIGLAKFTACVAAIGVHNTLRSGGERKAAFGSGRGRKSRPRSTLRGDRRD